MKNKIYNLTIVVMIAIFSSCENAIDITQVGRVTADVAYTNVSELKDGLIGTYGFFDLTREVAMAVTYTDETAEGTENGGQGRTTGSIFNLNAGSAAASTFWTNGYDRLNALNRLIEAADLVEPANATETAEKNDILGQAHALRAYANFQMVSYFSTDYTNDDALAVLKVDFVPSIADKLLRSTNKELFDLIGDDLTKAASLIADQSNPIFVSKDFVTALRARMAAYRQDYTTAETLASSLMTKYPLANRTQYRLMFVDEDNTEIIFKLQRDVNGIYDNQPGSGTVAATGWIGGVTLFGANTPYYEIGRSLFNLIDPSDVRYNVIVDPVSIVAPDYTNTANYRTEDVLQVNKYPGKPGQVLLNDNKVFRSSEMHLIVVEAKISRNDLTGAALDIKTLRDARFGTAQTLPVYGSQQEAYAALLNERRVEFAFEGHRWKDIKRLGVRANQGAERDPIDVAEFGMTATLAPNDYRFTLPIPLVEFNANPELRAQQNPGYNN
tara:strand:+ start:3329 stop:4822 length:1494 start_codon:yes stop_codon:yes gene_type:complete